MEHYFTNNNDLKSELRTLTYKCLDEELKFTSDLGVFSKDKIDYGSRLLIENYINDGEKNIKLLDVGCGYGVIGLSLSKMMNTTSTLIDINKRSIHLAKMNAKSLGIDATIIESNIYENINDTYDVIITNPPIRAGKEVVMNILNNAYDYLTSDGSLWFVMRKDHGVKSYIKRLENKYEISIKKKSKGFYIIVAKKH